ncbi:SafA/ExsA family spore coat assembly protein [Lederbergia panacisoli]|uniref:SafA/ExsA family spore coat assembly protein n=1 Tax=Lederbergia panacisoli TaxID=1255251 RepID=UPI00214C4E10|nr:SafA/ExsA family spore coat assembly protein [Lederbergia panacisoli]MCR2820526.1 SafA/ExsA family spore coat assembly protein [Lederbergia panacisoli]
MKIHIAQKGETLWKIAKKYGVDFEELKKMNAQLSNPDMIMPGMKIKVPGGSAGKEHHMPHHAPKEHHIPKHVPKEMPKVEHIKKEVPVPIVQPKEIIKEVVKEKPYPIYQPVMPQPLPEIDISNYYMMNMQQSQTQVQSQKEEVVEEVPVQMPVMPVQPVQQPVYNYCYPVMPICDPCYNPYSYGYQPQMMPQVQGAMMQPMPMAMQPQAMPGVPATGYEAGVPGWHDESSSHPEMYWGQAPSGMQPSAQQAMPYQGYQMPYTQAPMMEAYPAMPGTAPAAMPCGCGGNAYAPYPYARQAVAQSVPFNPYPFGSILPTNHANAYAMPARNDDGFEDE